MGLGDDQTRWVSWRQWVQSKIPSCVLFFFCVSILKKKNPIWNSFEIFVTFVRLLYSKHFPILLERFVFFFIFVLSRLFLCLVSFRRTIYLSTWVNQPKQSLKKKIKIYILFRLEIIIYCAFVHATLWNNPISPKYIEKLLESDGRLLISGLCEDIKEYDFIEEVSSRSD